MNRLLKEEEQHCYGSGQRRQEQFDEQRKPSLKDLANELVAMISAAQTETADPSSLQSKKNRLKRTSINTKSAAAAAATAAAATTTNNTSMGRDARPTSAATIDIGVLASASPPLRPHGLSRFVAPKPTKRGSAFHEDSVLPSSTNRNNDSVFLSILSNITYTRDDTHIGARKRNGSRARNFSRR